MSIVMLEPQVKKKLEAELQAAIPTPDERSFESFAEELRRTRPDLHRELVLGLKVVPKMPAEQAAERAVRRVRLRGVFERLFFQTRWPNARVLDKRRVVLAGLLALMVVLPSVYLLGNGRPAIVERLEPSVLTVQALPLPNLEDATTTPQATPPLAAPPLEFGTLEPPPPPTALNAPPLPPAPIPPFTLEVPDLPGQPIPPSQPAPRPASEAATAPPPLLRVAASSPPPQPVMLWRQPAINPTARVTVFAQPDHEAAPLATVHAQPSPPSSSVTTSPLPEPTSLLVTAQGNERGGLRLFVREAPALPSPSEVAKAELGLVPLAADAQGAASHLWTPGMRFPATLAVGLAVAEGGISPVIAETLPEGCGNPTCPVVLWVGTARLAATGRVEMTFTEAVVGGESRPVNALALGNDGSVGVASAPQDVTLELAQNVLHHAAAGVADYARALAARQQVTIERNRVVSERDVPGVETFILGSLAELLTPSATTARVASLAAGTSFMVLYGVGGP